MKITFLGTGTSQGVPVIACECPTCMSVDPHDNRLRTSLLLETDGVTLLFDAGPDFRQQMLREKVKKLDAILITHEHKDHIAGMDDVRAFNYKSQDAVDIYAEERVQKAIKREFSYVFSEYQYPGIPRFRLNDIPDYGFYSEGHRHPSGKGPAYEYGDIMVSGSGILPISPMPIIFRNRARRSFLVSSIWL